MKIMVNNLKRQYELYAEEYDAKALDVLRSGWYVLGKEVSDFEKEFAQYVWRNGEGHCVGLASGLDALWISFRLLNIGCGDEVIVCAHSYIACVMGITIPGATPVFVEPDKYDNIDADRIEAAITPATKAILAVHLYGQSCDMTKIVEIAQRHRLRVVEDCAQSHGTCWNGQMAGTFGDIGCFSFYPTKGCGAFGDGGAIVTNDSDLAQQFRCFRNYGSHKQYEFELVGANSRLDELQAGLLRVKLSHLDTLNQERAELAQRYLNEISNPVMHLPQVRPGSSCVWHQFVIHTVHRNELIRYLANAEIGTAIHYPIPPHLSKAYASLGKKRGDYPLAEQIADEVLSLPLFNGMNSEEQTYVIDKLNQFVPEGT
jgi:dTDP-4-amino-4,6-dideoxygalactose transaminase